MEWDGLGKKKKKKKGSKSIGKIEGNWTIGLKTNGMGKRTLDPSLQGVLALTTHKSQSHLSYHVTGIPQSQSQNPSNKT